MDLSKLRSAPWAANKFMEVEDSTGKVIADTGFDEDAEFIALARNAFDVMMRRGWGVYFNEFAKKWAVYAPSVDMLFCHVESLWCDDPFTALVETDKWYRENVENKP